MSYTPTIPPADPAAIPHYLTTELQALAQSLQQSQPYAYLQTLNVAPAKPREGLIAKADGTHWNPGSGAGVYCYIAGAWVFFGGGGGTGTVTHTSGALTAHAVIVGNGTADVKALAALGASGTVLTSNGAGADPSFQPGGGTGTVTSVGVGSTGSTLTVTGSPVTGSGTINADLNLGHRNEWTASQNVGQVALTDASTITPNGALSNNFYLLTTTGVGSSRIMAVPTSLNAGDIVNFEVKQPASGGPCVIAWAAGYLWGQGGSAPPPIASQTASASEFYSFTVQNNGNLHGVMIGQSGPAGAGYKATSTTSQSTGTGSKTFTTQAGLAWLPGGRVRFTSTGTGEFMEGVITSYSIASMVVLIDLNNCTGAHTDWDINAAGQQGATGTTGSPGSSNFAGTSVTSNTVGLGSLTFTTQSGLAYQVGARVRVTDSAAPSNYVEGICTAYSGTSITVNSDLIGGSGTFTTWNLNIAGQPGTGGTSGVSFFAQASATTSLGGGLTLVAFGTTVFDTGGYYNSTTSRFTPPAGTYLMTTGLYITGVSNNGEVAFYKNGSLLAEAALGPPYVGSMRPNASYLVQVNGTDYLQIYGYGGGTGTVQSGSSTYFSAFKIA